jgi:predicted alpha-1,6-mannanase (GH76 family)
MKNFIFIFILLSTCVAKPPKTSDYWSNIADSGSKALVNSFWNVEKKYFNDASDTNNWNREYWPQAHALDVLVDAYLRSGDVFYKNCMLDWLTGVRAANGNTWNNTYIDDMEWIGLAALRAYQATGRQEFMQVCLEVWNGIDDDMTSRVASYGIKRAWTDAGNGGIFWEGNSHRHSKNACSNGPAAILAANLYNELGNEDDKQWALKIYAWLKETLFNPETGAVYDNIDTNTGEINKRWVFTYNQGTFLGAAVELYKITGDKTYIADAVKAADYTINVLINSEDGILKSEGRGDGGLFKGIFIRNFAQLILSDGISDQQRQKYVDFLVFNGETLWNEGTYKELSLFGPYWKTAPESKTGLTEHLSGCMLMEALAMLQKAGRI